MEVETIEPSEPVLLKKRGRPKGSLNKKTIQKMKEDVEPIEPAHEESSLYHAPREMQTPETPETLILARGQNNLERAAPDSMVLDVEFTSDKIFGEKSTPKRKPRAGRTRDPPTEPSVSESGDDTPPPPPPPPLKRQRSSLRIETTPSIDRSDTCPSILEPNRDSRPSYLEVLTRGLKEARAKQYAEKVAQYDRFFQW